MNWFIFLEDAVRLSRSRRASSALKASFQSCSSCLISRDGMLADYSGGGEGRSRQDRIFRHKKSPGDEPGRYKMELLFALLGEYVFFSSQTYFTAVLALQDFNLDKG